MRRREFIAGLCGAIAALPFAARAQQAGRMPRVLAWIGTNRNDPEFQMRAEVFRKTLAELGWVDGRNARIEVRWSANTPEDIDSAAAEFAALQPDVIVTAGAPLLAAMHRQTKTVPIVFTLVTDPVSDGFVASLAHPGGNVTGFTIFEHSFAGKWLEMLKEVVPGVAKVAVMQNPDHPAWNGYLNAIRNLAAGMNVGVVPAPITGPADVEPSLREFSRGANGGLILLPSLMVTQNRKVIADAALRFHLPSIYLARNFAVAGGLMSYGPVNVDALRQAATYVDRILKGAKPAVLPVQAANKFEMVINLTTAKALGITVPATMLGRADEVIE
jgi:putative tryptophan/tyrosine transport system substrate-binding protein